MKIQKQLQLKQQQTKKTSQGPETTKVCGIKTAGLRKPYRQTLSGTGICSQISCQLIRYTEREGKSEAKNSDENDCSYSDPTWVLVGSTIWPATVCYIHCYDACKCHCQKHNEVSKCQHICGSQVAGTKDLLTRAATKYNRSEQQTQNSLNSSSICSDFHYITVWILPISSCCCRNHKRKPFFFTFFLLNMNTQNLEKNQKKVITTTTTTIKPKCTKPWEKSEESNHHHHNNKTKMYKTLRKIRRK